MEHPENKELKCEHPEELRGNIFIELDPDQFCDQPMVVRLGIQDIQPFSVLVSWQSRNHSGLHGYQVAYYSIDTIDEVSFYIWINMCNIHLKGLNFKTSFIHKLNFTHKFPNDNIVLVFQFPRSKNVHGYISFSPSNYRLRCRVRIYFMAFR